MSDAPTSHVLTTIENGVLELRLNRPEKKNALTYAMYRTMAAALQQAATDESIKAILFSAAGDFYTAGNDLADFASMQSGPPQGGTGGSIFLPLLLNAEKPVIAAVQGHAVGIGVTMLPLCDLVYVAEDARLTTPFANLGLIPEAASSVTFVQRMGYARAFAMLGLGEPISGREAASMGIANAALPAGEVLARAKQAAQTLAAKPAEALRITKRLMKKPSDLDARMQEEFALFIDRLKSPEAQAAFAAFLNKSG